MELGSGIQGRLGEIQEALRRHVEGVKWVEPENFHLTLKFLGEVPEDRVPAVREALAAVAREHPPAELELQGVGCFPNARRPRVLWVGVHEGREPLVRLARHLDRELAGLGFASEARPGVPARSVGVGHVTLGRIRKPAPAGPGLEKEILALERSRVGRREVGEFCLVQSQLRRAGPLYTVLERFALSGLPLPPR